MSTPAIQAPPACHTRRFLEYLKHSHSYGRFAAEIQSHFSRDKTFSFATLAAHPGFRALPAPFKTALRRLYAELVKAHKGVQAYEGLQPQAAFDRATRLSGQVTNVTVYPFALVFAMEWEEFQRLQTANGGIENPFSLTIASTLKREVLRDRRLDAMVCLIPEHEGVVDALSASHEVWHAFLNRLPVIGSQPLETLLQRRRRLLEEAQASSSFPLLLEEKKLTFLDELRCRAMTGELFTCLSQSDLENMLKPYKPLVWGTGQFGKRQQKQQIRAVWEFYQIIPPLWQFIDSGLTLPSLGWILLALDYPQIATMLKFAVKHQEAFKQEIGLATI